MPATSSLKTKARMPVVSSRKKMIPRNTENYDAVGHSRSDAAGEAQDEHDGPDHHEEPDRVQAPQVRDGRDVGQHPLEGRESTAHSLSQAAQIQDFDL
ncbi:hypothetical protein EYF80_043157 [Liparis tanakae]|uniref:Uncharacterized protein n=1 Tax=Liparis tanakae TaxID=230148 RepID=A0A4Z2G1B0_9TELE|nr:hypothetical protein EYF80_043157 [Liparis tanakae]